MPERKMHETIRGFYEGIFEPRAWQRSLHALCESSGSVRASLLVLDTLRHTVQVRQVVNRLPEDPATEPLPFGTDGGLPLARPLEVGGWYIDRRDTAGAAAMRHPIGGGTFDEVVLTSMMACLIDRHPTHEIYLALQRPAGDDSYTEADAHALNWAIPHLREALAQHDRTHGVVVHGQVSADLLNHLPFGVIVFAQSGKVLLANSSGAPWVRWLLPTVPPSQDDASTPAGKGKGNGWHLSRPFGDVLHMLGAPGTTHTSHALHATRAGGRSAQVVAIALTPNLYLTPEWQDRPVLVTVHEDHVAPRATSTVLRDLYGLTPAEVRLAVLLTTGIGLPDACVQIGIKRETSRSQLKSIFTKTNTSTQAQLAHLLTRLGSVLARPASA